MSERERDVWKGGGVVLHIWSHRGKIPCAWLTVIPSMCSCDWSKTMENPKAHPGFASTLLN